MVSNYVLSQFASQINAFVDVLKYLVVLILFLKVLHYPTYRFDPETSKWSAALKLAFFIGCYDLSVLDFLSNQPINA
jgi:hypothetical protein